jgi:hypothetical protein
MSWVWYFVPYLWYLKIKIRFMLNHTHNDQYIDFKVNLGDGPEFSPYASDCKSITSKIKLWIQHIRWLKHLSTILWSNWIWHTKKQQKKTTKNICPWTFWPAFTLCNHFKIIQITTGVYCGALFFMKPFIQSCTQLQIYNKYSCI